VGHAADKELCERISLVHANRASIEAQAQALQTRTTTLAKQSKQWQSVVDKANHQLKMLGDVQNWAEVIDREIRILEETFKILNEER